MKLKQAIESEMNRRDVEALKQTFKKSMSIVFAAIVGLVILGFFAVALQDVQVRREIFAGQAGMQFITLFSLVIAIILFGITGVLEGKELSALLGGLAGYILGRSGSSAPAPPSQGGSQQQGSK
jgi:small-conductance mechanosensitive channel